MRVCVKQHSVSGLVNTKMLSPCAATQMEPFSLRQSVSEVFFFLFFSFFPGGGCGGGRLYLSVRHLFCFTSTMSVNMKCAGACFFENTAVGSRGST